MSSSVHLASEFEPEAPLDDEWRFLMFDSVDVGTVRHPAVGQPACVQSADRVLWKRMQDSKRGFMFGKIPTTDDQDAAATDLDYLDSVSAIRVETYTITNARYVITGWEQPTPSKKPAEKRNANEITGSPTAKVSTSNSHKEASGDAVKPEQPPMPKSVRQVEASLRPIDERSDKGKFGLAPRQVLHLFSSDMRDCILTDYCRHQLWTSRSEGAGRSDRARERDRGVRNGTANGPEPVYTQDDIAAVMD